MARPRTDPNPPNRTRKILAGTVRPEIDRAVREYAAVRGTTITAALETLIERGLSGMEPAGP